jgi:hypothetical protein
MPSSGSCLQDLLRLQEPRLRQASYLSKDVQGKAPGNPPHPPARTKNRSGGLLVKAHRTLGRSGTTLRSGLFFSKVDHVRTAFRTVQ